MNFNKFLGSPTVEKDRINGGSAVCLSESVSSKNSSLKVPVGICLCLVLGMSKSHDKKERAYHLCDFFKEVDAMTKDTFRTAFGVLFQVRTIPILSFPENESIDGDDCDNRATELVKAITDFYNLYKPMEMILHFICHGKNNGHGIIYGAGENEYIDYKCISYMLRALESKKDIKIVGIVFSACNTHAFAQNISSSLRYAIGHKGLLLNTSAHVFSHDYYFNLCNGDSPYEAYEKAERSATAQQEKDAVYAGRSFNEKRTSADRFQYYGNKKCWATVSGRSADNFNQKSKKHEIAEEWEESSSRIEIYDPSFDKIVSGALLRKNTSQQYSIGKNGKHCV